jgi:hypothetical protein
VNGGGVGNGRSVILAVTLGLLVSPPGFEPGLPRPQRGVLTTIRWRLFEDCDRGGVGEETTRNERKKLYFFFFEFLRSIFLPGREKTTKT